MTHLSESHTLLLNKFNIVPHHVLVVTRDFQQQTDLLKLGDFEATWAVLQVRWHEGHSIFLIGVCFQRSSSVLARSGVCDCASVSLTHVNHVKILM